MIDTRTKHQEYQRSRRNCYSLIFAVATRALVICYCVAVVVAVCYVLPLCGYRDIMVRCTLHKQ